ncbi:topoisomerase, partial [Neglecta sp. X4]|nr:topoisomerase [Neglectibacter sp. X4]
MPYIAPEVIEQARQIDLLTYLQACEPDELVRISPNNY